MALLGTFAALNLVVLAAAPYFDSNFLLMSDINDRKWADGADVLFLGDSRTHQGVIPAVFSDELAKEGVTDTTAMNLARPGQQLPFAYFFSNKVAAEAAHKPKAVVLNISFYLLGGDQWMKDIYFAYYQPSLGDVWSACTMRLLYCDEAATWAVSTRLPAATFRSRANTMIKSMIADPTAAIAELEGIQGQRATMRFDVAAGYMTRGDGHIEPSDVPMPHGYTTGAEQGYKVYLNYLDKMIGDLTAQGIEVFVYQFPWPEQRENETGFKDVLAYYDALLGGIAADRVHFLPTYRFWPTEYFVDPLHLNEAGARRLTVELADELAANPAFQAAMTR